MSNVIRPGKIWRQRGILVGLFVTFLASGLMRLGHLDIAFAATDGTETQTGSPTMQDETTLSGDPAIARLEASDTPQQCATLGSIDVALAAINSRASELDEREADIAARETTVAAAEEVVIARLQELETAETRLRDLLTIADTAADNDLQQLTSLYESMQAEDAAELFGQMDPSFAAGFLARMRPEAGAGILSELEPNQAYAISIILATRNTSLTDAMADQPPSASLQ